MLVRDIFGLDGLAELGSRHGVDMRPTLLRVLTDLYVHRLSHSPAEERHYTELALRLLEAVDAPTRAAVARRFARYPSPPPRVLQWLSRDLPEVTAELRAYPPLQPAAPAEATNTNTAAPTPAAENPTASREQLGKAAYPLDLAIAEELNESFFAASAEERRLILLNLHVIAPLASSRTDALRDQTVARRLEQAALTGKRDDFARELARALLVPREQARRIVRDDLGEPVVVAAKMLGLPRALLYRVLMFLNPAVGHSVERVHALATLYEEMTVPAAKGILAIWQALQPSDPAKYQPVNWDDEARRRARPATPVQRAATAVRPGQRHNVS